MEVFPFPEPPPGASVVTDPAELEALFSENRSAHLYSLCDLEPPFWTHSRWYRRGDATVGLVGNEPGELVTVCAVSTADPAGSNTLLAEIAPQLTGRIFVTGPVGMSEALADSRPVSWKTDEVRYWLEHHTNEPAAGVEPLGIEQTPELERLYGTEPAAAFFLPSMVASDSFVGVWNDDRSELFAAAGTHVLSDEKRIAAIGAVYVRPDQRGRGLGTQCTLGVVERLSGRVDTIGLNASRTNTAARTIYERLGFSRLLDFEEVELPALDELSSAD